MQKKSPIIIPIIPKDQFFKKYLSDCLNIELVIHEDCNLQCKFCNLQNHYKIDYSQIDYIIDCLNRSIPTSKVKRAHIVIMGGEVFQDKFENLHYIEQLLECIVNNMVAKNIEYDIAITTNLIYKKIDRVIDLIKKYNININASFDLYGRYTKQSQVDLYLANLEKLNKSNVKINIPIIVSKKVFNVFKTDTFDGDFDLYNIFKKLVKTYSYCFQQYDDMNDIPEYVITEKQYGEFIIWLINNHPECDDSLEYLDLYFNNGFTRTKCTSENIDSDFYDHKLVFTTCCCDLKKSYHRLIMEKGCLTCNYSRMCDIICPNDMERGDFCIHRMIFDYINSNKVRLKQTFDNLKNN